MTIDHAAKDGLLFLNILITILEVNILRPAAAIPISLIPPLLRKPIPSVLLFNSEVIEVTISSFIKNVKV